MEKLDHGPRRIFDGLLCASMASTAVPPIVVKNVGSKFQEIQKYTNFACFGRICWKYILVGDNRP